MTRAALDVTRRGALSPRATWRSSSSHGFARESRWWRSASPSRPLFDLFRIGVVGPRAPWRRRPTSSRWSSTTAARVWC